MKRPRNSQHIGRRVAANRRSTLGSFRKVDAVGLSAPVLVCPSLWSLTPLAVDQATINSETEFWRSRSQKCMRAPCWHSEPRPEGYDSVDLHSNLLSEKDFAEFVAQWLPRHGYSHLIFGGSDLGSSMSGFSGEPQPVVTPPSRAVPDEDFVEAFLRSQKDIKKLMCYERGVERVSQIKQILTYGVTIPQAVENLKALGVDLTVDALQKQIERLRKAMDETELPQSRDVLLKIADESPEGTADYLRRAARRSAQTFGGFTEKFARSEATGFQSSQFEHGLLGRKNDPIKYLKSDHSNNKT